MFASSAWIAFPAAAALGVVAASGSAQAGNSQHPRTPVEWDNVTCMEFVDRTVEANYDLVYGIPFEDTDVTPEEVVGSRTQQFFALCRQTSPQEDLPSWISMADVEQTLINYEDFVTPQDDDIFELATEWDGCWHRITQDADRRPITDAASSQPVSWDTSVVPAGAYVLLGYTYEPVSNLWSPRVGGVVRVHDEGDPAADGPAGAISTGEQSPCVGDTVRIEGCVSALPGTTMTASFAITSGPDASDPDWTAFAEDVPVQGDQFALEWVVPQEAGGASTLLRVDFTDPNGETYTAYQYEANVVLPADSAGCGAEPDDCMGGFVMDPACETTGAGSTTDAAETDSGTSAAGSDGGDDGCGCRSQGDTPAGWGVLGLVALLARRRRQPMWVIMLPFSAKAASRRGQP